MDDIFSPTASTMPESAGFLHSIFDAMLKYVYPCVKTLRSRPRA
jgi:hypothetical protein